MFKQWSESFKAYREKLKEEAKRVKKYLKGKVIPGTESYYSPKKRLESSRNFLDKYRAHRKIKNKMAYKSRRINHLRG